MHTYSNPSTQAYVNGLYSDIQAREERIASLRRSVEQSRPQARSKPVTVKISTLSLEEQGKVVRLTKES